MSNVFFKIRRKSRKKFVKKKIYLNIIVKEKIIDIKIN